MVRIGLGLAIIASLTLIGATQSAFASHAKVSIAVGGFYFCDPDFQLDVCKTDVAAGTTVTWTFTGIHTTTECDGPCDPMNPVTIPPLAPLWDSGELTTGDTFSYTFTTPGVYNYYCRRHPLFMFGQINVGPAGPSVGGVAEIDSASGAGRDAAEPDAGASSVAPAIAIVTAAALVAGLIGAAWFVRRRPLQRP